MGMHRRALLLGSVAGALSAPAWAQQACFDTFDRCFGNVLPGAPSLDLNFLAGAPSGLVYTGGGGTFFNAAGAITAATTNVPRFDADPVTHAARGMLIEEARTNLLLNSATLGTQSVTTTAVTTTLSFYGTGTVTLSGTFAGTLVGSGAFPARNSLTFTPTAGTLTATVTGSVLNAQIEAGAFQTSWISTAGAAATRTADAASIAVGVWFTAGAGSMAADFNLIAQNPNNQILAQFDDGATTNRVLIRNNAATSLAQCLVVAGGATQLNNGGTLSFGANIKAALSWQAGLQLTAVGGVSAGGATGALNPTGITTLRIGSDNTSIQQANGRIRRVRYWSRPLTAIELQQVTT